MTTIDNSHHHHSLLLLCTSYLSYEPTQPPLSLLFIIILTSYFIRLKSKAYKHHHARVGIRTPTTVRVVLVHCPCNQWIQTIKLTVVDLTKETREKHRGTHPLKDGKSWWQLLKMSNNYIRMASTVLRGILSVPAMRLTGSAAGFDVLGWGAACA